MSMSMKNSALRIKPTTAPDDYPPMVEFVPPADHIARVDPAITPIEYPEHKLLPLDVRQEMEFAYAVFSWETYTKTIAKMAMFGPVCMKKWFPQGPPTKPTREAFGLPSQLE